MLTQLSFQERQAISYYNEQVQSGNTQNFPIWVDDFSQSIFYDLPENGEVIDIGCGIGRSVGILHGLGITQYLGIDPASDCIAYCTKQFATSHVQFEVNEMRTVGDSYPNRFDGFLCLAMLMHIPRSDVKQAFASLRKCLRVGANGLLSSPYADEGDPHEYVSPVADINCTLFSIGEIESALDANGFEVVRVRVDEQMYLAHIRAN